MVNKFVIKPLNLLYVFILLNLIIALFIVPDYGRSTDESHEYRTSSVALRVYTSELTDSLKDEYENLAHDRFYGTAITASIQFVERFFFPERDHSAKVVAHYCYFVLFQAAILAVFLLAKHFLDDWSSLGTAILFGTQPLLFGHAFINPKDIPLLTVFLFAVVTGFQMVEKWTNSSSEIDNKVRAITPVEGSQYQNKRKLLFIVTLLATFLVLWSSSWITRQIVGIVEYGYSTQGSSLIGKLFAAATTFGSLEGYLTLTKQFIYTVFKWILFGTPFLLLVLFYKAGRNQLFGKYINLYVLFAAAAWGLAISTRVVAFAAGGMVGLYALAKIKGKSIFPLMIYTITTFIFSYITWPFLWVYGFSGYLESFRMFNDFPWTGGVLFEGQLFLPINLPIKYLPKLMLLQFTEPFVVLALAGLLVGFYLLYKKKLKLQKWLLLYAWFFIPLLYAMFGKSTIYNNFRHFLFITPPLFIFAGIALQQIKSLLNKRAWILLLYLLCILPGLISILQIHPYQYMYYNRFTGGIEGAYHSYEMDYWNTAYIGAMDYVNENAPPGSKILVWKDNLLGKIYSEGEFTFTAHTTVPEHEYQYFDYAIMPSGRFDDIAVLKNSPVIYSVDIQNASLIVILKISP